MKLRMKSAVAGVTALALAGAGLAFAAQANAYTGSGPGGAPSWVAGDTTRKGAVLFYDASGNQLTGGSSINSLSAAYVGTSGTAPRSGATKATAYVAAPDPGQTLPALWAFQNMTPNFTWSPSPAGTPTFSPNAPGAFVKLTAAGTAIEDLVSGITLYSGANTDYLNVLEIRVQDAGTGVAADGGKYWATDIEFNPTSATAPYDGLAPGAWRVVWPATVGGTTTTTVSTNPASGSATTATPVTLTATVSPATAAGTVQFQVDGANVGGAIAVAGGTASFNAGLLGASAGHTVRADFTPVNPAGTVGFAGSFGTTSLPVTQVTAGTATAVSGPTTATVGTSATYTASVTAGGGQVPAGHGSVQFTVNGTNVGSPVPYAGGAVSFAYQPTAAGSVAISAVFSGDAAFGNSTGNVVAVTVSAPAYTPDPQNVTVVVPQGTLVISTPYTVANPLSLGTMALNAAGTQYSASALFGDPSAVATADPGQITGTENPPALVAKQSNGVTITDTRANGPGWTASVTANDFADGSGHTISGDNLTFTQITPKYLAGNALQSGVAVPAGASVTGFKSATKTFASLATVPSTGTVAITANLGLVAPTSTVAGTYTATITFSIV